MTSVTASIKSPKSCTEQGDDLLALIKDTLAQGVKFTSPEACQLAISIALISSLNQTLRGQDYAVGAMAFAASRIPGELRVDSYEHNGGRLFEVFRGDMLVGTVEVFLPVGNEIGGGFRYSLTKDAFEYEGTSVPSIPSIPPTPTLPETN